MELSENYFLKFKELTLKKIGKSQYEKMTEQELFASFMSLITLVDAIYKPISKKDYEKYGRKE